MKRPFDLFLSLAGILFFAPLMLIISVIIKCTSPGPVLYRQKRAGWNFQVSVIDN